MLSILGLITIVALLVLVMTKRVSPVVALIAVPIFTALVGGFGFEVVTFITDGLKSISTTAVMFIFAILFFGVLMDAGTFEPVISKLIRAAGNDPARIAVVTAVLAMLVHLDGSGAVTFLITIPALLPVYDAMGMKRTTLATVVALGAGTMNILPWGGPTIRAATALDISVNELFTPLLIPFAVGLAAVLAIAWVLGKRERRTVTVGSGAVFTAPSKDTSLHRPRLLWVNWGMIAGSIGVMITEVAPPHVVFMVAFIVAIVINYPDLTSQRERIDSHAKAALLMATILFAAGCFTGILKGSGMIDAMASSGVRYIPDSVGSHLALITGLVSMPASLLFDPDSFYFGVLPLLGTTATHFGGDAVEVGRAAILGQMTTGFPVSPLTGSTFLLIGLTGVDLGEHQRKTIPLAFLVTLVMLAVSVFVGSISF